MLVLTNESKEKIKKFDKQWSKIRDLIRSKTQMNMLKKYMKIKFNTDHK